MPNVEYNRRLPEQDINDAKEFSAHDQPLVNRDSCGGSGGGGGGGCNSCGGGSGGSGGGNCGGACNGCMGQEK